MAYRFSSFALIAPLTFTGNGTPALADDLGPVPIVVKQDAPACALLGRLQMIYVDIAQNHEGESIEQIAQEMVADFPMEVLKLHTQYNADCTMMSAGTRGYVLRTVSKSYSGGSAEFGCVYDPKRTDGAGCLWIDMSMVTTDEN